MKTLNQLFILSFVIIMVSCNNDDSFENNPPVINDQNLTINENPTDINLLQITAMDEDQDELMFFINNQTPSGATSFNNSTGFLEVADFSSFDYEVNQQIVINISVTDGIDTDTATITITLNDVVDLEPIIENQSFNIDEGALNQTVIGQISATDPQNLSLTYALISESINGAFAIDASKGMLTVNEEFPYNYEVNTSIIAAIRVSNGTFESDATITVNINDLDYPQVGLRAGYLFDDLTNNIATDITNSFDGEVIGNVSLVLDRNNVSNSAFHFNQGRIKIEEGALNGLNNFTITGWAKADNDVDGTIFNKGTPSASDIEIVAYYSNNTLALRYIDPVTNLHNPVEQVSGPGAGQWFHFAAVVENGTTWSLYINGIQADIHEFNNANEWSDENINIGAIGNSNFWNGAIDDILIYDRVLSQDEIYLIAIDDY